MRKPGSKQKIREFLTANIGIFLSSRQITDAADGAAQATRRLRELREQEGWEILTHNDTNSLKPGEYLLKSLPQERKDVKFVRNISSRLKAQVLDRNGFTCQMCGLTPGEIDPSTNRKVRLHIGHIVDKSLGGRDELGNLRALCSTCNQGAKNITTEKATSVWLLSQIRRAGNDEQKIIFDWLRKKFES